jgi:hypothetical protein
VRAVQLLALLDSALRRRTHSPPCGAGSGVGWASTNGLRRPTPTASGTSPVGGAESSVTSPGPSPAGGAMTTRRTARSRVCAAIASGAGLTICRGDLTRASPPAKRRSRNRAPRTKANRRTFPQDAVHPVHGTRGHREEGEREAGVHKCAEDAPALGTVTNPSVGSRGCPDGSTARASHLRCDPSRAVRRKTRRDVRH